MVEAVYSITSEHGWISDSVGGPCDQQNPPDFFQNCGYDLTLNVASWLYSDVNQTQQDTYYHLPTEAMLSVCLTPVHFANLS